MFSSEPLITVEDMHMAEMYAELLDGVAARVAGMARSGLPAVNDEEAREFGRRVAVEKFGIVRGIHHVPHAPEYRPFFLAS